MTDQSILLFGSQLFGPNCSAIAQLADYGYVVEIPRDTPFGVRIRWVATPYSDEWSSVGWDDVETWITQKLVDR